MIISYTEKVDECRDHYSLTEELSSHDESECFILCSENLFFYAKRGRFLKKVEIEDEKKNPDDKIGNPEKNEIWGYEVFHRSEDKVI